MGPVLEFLPPGSTVITISGPLIETSTTVSEAAMQPSPASRVHLFEKMTEKIARVKNLKMSVVPMEPSLLTHSAPTTPNAGVQQRRV